MKATSEQVEKFLRDVTYGTKYEFLEVGKNDEELADIAKRRGLVLPSPDLAIFKARYALVDKKNRNNCILERDDVEGSLDTLIGKRVDIDHLTRKVVGYWIDAKIDGQEIVSYGAIFKSSFGDEFDEIKKMMQEGQAGVSFEAWGEREFHSDKSYSLRKIHFAGGGLLLTTEPAEPSARILELAKVMTPPKRFFEMAGVEEKEQKTEAPKLEEFAQWSVWDMDIILRLLSELKAKNGNQIRVSHVESIDFDNGVVICEGYEVDPKADYSSPTYKEPQTYTYQVNLSPAVKAQPTSAGLERTVIDVALVVKTEPEVKDEDQELIDELEGESVEEAAKLSSKQRNSLSDSDFAVVVTKNGKKIRMFPIHDAPHVRNALARIAQPGPQATLRKLGVSVESVKQKIARKAKQFNIQTGAKTEMDEQIDALKKQVEAKDAELAELKKSLELKTTEAAQLKERVDLFEKAEKDKKLAERKDVLGEFAKDLSDEQLLSDGEFANAKLRKENADLKKQLDSAGKGPKTLDAGSTRKSTGAEYSVQKTVQSLAFGADSAK